MKENVKKFKWQIITWATIGLLGWATSWGYNKFYLSGVVEKEAAEKFAYDYCNTLSGVPTHTVTLNNAMLYIDYETNKFFPIEESGYEFRGYIGNYAGIKIGNSQNNTHEPGAWDSSYYAKNYDDKSRVLFKGNGLHIPRHLVDGQYSYIIEMVFHTKHGPLKCTTNVPFKIDWNDNGKIDL